MGLIGTLITVAAVAVLGLGGTGAYLYATDYTLKADVQKADCGAINVVTIKTRIGGLVHDVKDLPDHECLLLKPGDYVEYHIRTKHTTLYDSKGKCVYDSQTGPGCSSGPIGLL